MLTQRYLGTSQIHSYFTALRLCMQVHTYIGRCPHSGVVARHMHTYIEVRYILSSLQACSLVCGRTREAQNGHGRVTVSQQHKEQGWEGALNRRNKEMTFLRKLGLCSGTDQASKLFLMRTGTQVLFIRGSLYFLILFFTVQEDFLESHFQNNNHLKIKK